nr:MAG TPA: hypothetical protein [Caudoviricetes sp.]
MAKLGLFPTSSHSTVPKLYASVSTHNLTCGSVGGSAPI